MKKKDNDSKVNVALTSLLVVFVCLLSFSVGVVSGKGWSDREYKISHIEQDDHVKMAEEDSEPLGDEMTEKEVELLTERALEEAKAQAPSALSQPSEPTTNPAPKGDVAPEAKEAMAEPSESETPLKRDISSIPERVVTTPKPTSIEYTVQVAAYKTMDEAERHSQKLIDKGFPAFPVKAMIEGQEWYRVSIGSFKNRDQAIQYEQALKKQAVVKSTFVQKIQRLQK